MSLMHACRQKVRILAKLPGIYCFVSKKKVIASGMHALVHMLGAASIAVVRLNLIVHDYFICTPDFSCLTNEIPSRLSINSSPGKHNRLIKFLQSTTALTSALFCISQLLNQELFPNTE